MKKIFISALAVIVVAVCSFSQTPVPSADSLKSSSKSVAANLSKKTIVTKNNPTNWSKIKDLFR